MIEQENFRFYARHSALLTALLLAACAGGEGPKTRFSPAPTSYFTVPVKPEDTLPGLAKHYQVKEEDLLALNGISDPAKELPGTTLRVPAYGHVRETREERPVVPPSSGYERAALPPPVAGSSPSQVASNVPIPKPRPNPPADQPEQAPPSWLDMAWFTSFTSEAPAPKVSAVKFDWPIQGPVISNFGAINTGERNDGINISASRGAAIHAAADGTVTYVGDELKAYGNLILIRHDNGYVTAYAHADSVVVQRGARVTRGQLIAYAGATGDVDKPQLHFELRVGTRPVDPKPYLIATK